MGVLLLVGVAAAAPPDQMLLGASAVVGHAPGEPMFDGVRVAGALVAGVSVEAWRARGRLREGRQRLGGVFLADWHVIGVPDVQAHDLAGGVGLGWDQGTRDRYVAVTAAVGLARYRMNDFRRGPVDDPRSVTIAGPWVRPELAFGVGLDAHRALEVGPYGSFVIPVYTEHHGGWPIGAHRGHFGLEITVVGR